VDSPITRAEHEEFCKRIDAENNRQNQRIKLLEEQTKQVIDLTLSVKELAQSIKQMTETQKEQGEKLEKLESRDGEMWRKVTGYIITTIIGIIIGFVFKQIGM
jgi:tetrahydromethanopterin S-methyltransferase subunit F